MARAANEISLTPVIELQPFDYPPDEEFFIWKSGGVDPIYEGSWIFEFHLFSDAELKRVLHELYFGEHAGDVDELLEDPDNFAPLISGGYLLRVDGRIVSRPGCCCGLDSIRDWQDAARGESGEIWTGHDKDDLVHYSCGGETAVLRVGDDMEIDLEPRAFFEVVLNAKKSLLKGMKRLVPLLNKLLNIEDGSRIVRAMVFKW